MTRDPCRGGWCTRAGGRGSSGPGAGPAPAPRPRCSSSSSHALAPPRQLDRGGLGGGAGGVIHHRFRGGGVVGRGLRHVEGGAGGGMAEHREVNSQYLLEEARHEELVLT